MAKALTADKAVNSYAIFIAGEVAAERMKQDMPVGHAHTCMDTAALPKIFKQIFAQSLLRDAFS